jgi:hypothetical protein
LSPHLRATTMLQLSSTWRVEHGPGYRVNSSLDFSPSPPRTRRVRVQQSTR